MALALVRDSLEVLNEIIATEYSEKDGKFFLNTEEAGGLKVEDVSGLKKSLGAVREELRIAKDSLKPFSGIEDPEAAKTALEKVAEMGNWDPDKEVAEKIQAREAQLVSRHNEAIKAAKDSSKALKDQLKSTLIDSAATKAISEAGGSVAVLLPHVKTRMRMRQDDSGQFVSEVLGEDGNPAIADGAGNAMTVTQLVSEMKASDTFSAVFKGNGATGGGASGSDVGGAASTQKVVAGQTKILAGSDKQSINNNLEGIASGDVRINPDI